MNTQNNLEIIKTMKQFSLCNYLQKLLIAKMHKVTLFPIFSLTSAANLSHPVHLVIIDEIAKFTTLNSGYSHN